MARPLLLLVALTIAGGSWAQTWSTELSPELDALRELAVSDPDAAMAGLQAHTPAVDEQAAHLLLLSRTHDALGFPAKALETAEAGLALADEGASPWLYHRLQLARSIAVTFSGRPREGVAGATAAIRWAEASGNDELLIDALGVRGHVHNSLLDQVSALADLNRAYAMAPERDAPTVRANIANLIALIYEYRQEHALAVPYFEETVEYFREENNRYELSIALYGLGRAHKHLGNRELGRPMLQESLEIAREVGDEQGVAYALKELAGDDLELRRPEDAVERLVEALAIFLQADNRLQLLDVYKTLVNAARQAGDLEAAEAWLVAGMQYVDRDNTPSQFVGFRIGEARLRADQGRLREAFDVLWEATELRRQLQTERSTRQLHEMRSRFELADAERANELLARENELQRARLEAEAQRTRVYQLAGALVTVVAALLALLAYRSARNRRALQQLADFDALTGLYRRGKALARLDSVVAAVDQEAGPLTVALLDLDHFKAINDTFGHAMGDRVLIAFGDLLRESLDGEAFAGRVGGEEFLLVYPGRSIDEALALIEPLRAAVPGLGPDLGLAADTLSVSGGIC
ncbi:MAG: diguanylate cyclase, partial [Pseudomonadota bacterium]